MEMRKVVLKTMSIMTAFALAIPIVLFVMPTQEVLAKNKEDYRMSQDTKDLIKECRDYWQEWGYDKAYSVEFDANGTIKLANSFCYYRDTNNKGVLAPYKDRLDGKQTHVAVTSKGSLSSYICAAKYSVSSYNKKVVWEGQPLSTATHVNGILFSIADGI